MEPEQKTKRGGAYADIGNLEEYQFFLKEITQLRVKAAASPSLMSTHRHATLAPVLLQVSFWTRRAECPSSLSPAEAERK